MAKHWSETLSIRKASSRWDLWYWKMGPRAFSSVERIRIALVSTIFSQPGGLMAGTSILFHLG